MQSRPNKTPTKSRQQVVIQDVVRRQTPFKPQPHTKLRRKLKRSFKLAIILIILIVLTIPSLFYFKPWERNQASTQATTTKQTVEELAAISTDEKPIILYVTDKDKVSQPFLEVAENGDEVRLYYQAKKAVLYRPSSDKVISTGEFTPPPAKVFLRSGTINTTSFKDAETKLSLNKDINIISRDKSASSGYANTLVIDISGRYKQQAASIAESLGGTLGNLPKGELAPEADILIIVGTK